MNPAMLALVLAGALAGLAIVLNHCHARLALVELTLNEGLPPGHQNTPTELLASSFGQSQSREITTLLGSGVHIFLSRNCHACQRLIDEFDETTVTDSHFRTESPTAAGAKSFDCRCLQGRMITDG